MPIDYRTSAEVRRIAGEFRRKHGALDWSARVDDLIGAHGYAQGRYSPTGIGARLKSLLTGVTKKVKALVSVQEKVILTADSLHPAREPFAKGHELGHAVIPWHQAILYVCDEHDLSPSARAQLEYEANEFASEVLVPRDLLQRVYSDYPISMDTVLAIRSWCGASIESVANTYVKHHPHKCVLMVLEDDENEHGQASLLLKHKVVSRPAVKDVMSTITKAQRFAAEHVLYVRSRTTNSVENCELAMRSGGKRLRASLLNNGYRTLVLVYE